MSPKAVYCPQYLESSFLAHRCTATMAAGISGTQRNSTSAAGKFTKLSTPNSVRGASMA